MDVQIKKIYDMLYSPIISPYNLLENAKLENYSYVKYYTNETGLVAEMQCEILGGGEQIFYYQFDKKDFLQKIYQGKIDNENVIVLLQMPEGSSFTTTKLPDCLLQDH